eukprot:CAMPEP_0202920684 /NCGR_PEP_ID=MMETSP1392-20130828/76988_1 /ASSEMBLY_ACC=CAM_ASM_000868 /TAXON_ID=225041 /ORGANISM="Chlamydomonas chlamydogama, Strain SAG 11-48b" /LENGTH=59 /DNA_ID=CAMNT_0049614191 /DNA_START=509 /DNA_END=688 /DNA_ORIENTATION=+
MQLMQRYTQVPYAMAPLCAAHQQIPAASRPALMTMHPPRMTPCDVTDAPDAPDVRDGAQ